MCIVITHCDLAHELSRGSDVRRVVGLRVTLIEEVCSVKFKYGSACNKLN